MLAPSGHMQFRPLYCRLSMVSGFESSHLRRIGGLDSPLSIAFVAVATPAAAEEVEMPSGAVVGATLLLNWLPSEKIVAAAMLIGLAVLPVVWALATVSRDM